MPAIASDGVEYTDEEIEDLEHTSKCPQCNEELDSGCWIPTMTANLECINCDWSIEYPYERRD